MSAVSLLDCLQQIASNCAMPVSVTEFFRAFVQHLPALNCISPKELTALCETAAA